MTDGARPRPPRDLTERRPRIHLSPEGAILHRFHDGAWEPIHFERSGRGRLSAPDASYGVLYCAERREGAFAETFLRSPGRTLLPHDLLSRRAYVALRARRPLRLAALYGPGLAILGATAEVTAGGLPYDLPQAWSQAIHRHPDVLDGIAYRARHDDDEICFALFDRAADAIEVVGREADLDTDWFYGLMNAYGLGLPPV